MMDTLILDNLSPFAFTKITTTHRPPARSTGGNNSNMHHHSNNNGLPIKKSTSSSNMTQSHFSNNYQYSNMGCNGAMRMNLQKNKIPTQGM